ncbi:MAG: hypothetical protein DMD90_02915 [Candidatus Rokuibacteriota bacterium]|nr:MAG: hypothetical protein DMD90_02915 [Candidatus Rokubacteria bacterium]
MQHLNELERQGLMSWRSEEHAWVADPDRVVQALRDGGFQEYKREIAKDNRSHATSGGMWQGLDPQSGVVATVIWHATPQEAHVFVEIDGRPFEGNAWAEIDDAVLGALTEGGGRLTPGQIAKRVGMSEDAVRSVVSMLAEQGKVRIAVVELPHVVPTKESLMRPPLARVPVSSRLHADEASAS